MADTTLKAKDGGYIGVSYARLAVLDPVTGKAMPGAIPGADANGIYKVSTKGDGGVANASLSGLAPSVTRIWGSNSIVDVSTGKAQPSVAFTTNFLNHQALAAVLGRADDGKGGYNLEGKNVDIALEIVSNTVAGGGIHFCFFDGYMTQGDLSLQTNNENESRVNDALTFTPFANDNGVSGKIYYDQDDGFEMTGLESEVFGVTATPASK